MNQTTNTSFLLDIFERFGKSEAQAALDFVRRNERTNAENKTPASIETGKLEDGVYIIHNDGSFERYYDGQTDTENLEMIGIVYDGHKFSLPLDGSYGEQKLLTRSDHPKDEYCQCECEALADWDFVKHTNHLKELGLGFELKEGHYLPTAPVWIAIYHNREIINKLLELHSAKPIDFEDDYWFAQRYGVNYAWFFHGGNGSLSYSGVYNGFQVQAVTLWE